MPGVLRSLAGRGLRAGAVGLALAGPAAADGPELPPDPIAASNRLTDPFHRPPVIQLMAAEAPWLTPGDPAPMPAGPVVPRPPDPAPPRPAPAMSVNWSAPSRRQAATVPLPVSDRPMIPCEPVALPAAPPVVLAPPRMEPPPGPQAGAPEPLPPPRPLPPEPASPPAKATMTAAPDDDFHAPKPVTTCRFLDEPAPAKPASDDGVIMAIIRRGGTPTGGAADVRTAVEAACRTKAVECVTEVAGERQVRVLLTVRSAEDWQRLYARLQALPALGEYGLLLQVRVQPESK